VCECECECECVNVRRGARTFSLLSGLGAGVG
jgi:hypothetical protein